MPFASRPVRTAACCILLISINFAGLLASSQTLVPSHTFPTADNPRITILNAATVSIAPWTQNCVSVTAEVSGETVNLEEVKIKPEKNKIEIKCVPLKPERDIHLTLKVPGKADLDIKSQTNRVEVKDPAGPLTVTLSASSIQLTVPESASLDMRDAPRAVEQRQLGQTGWARTAIGKRQVAGTGPPQVKVTAETAEVVVARGVTVASAPPSSGIAIVPPPFVRNPTVASTTIARRTGSLSRALRRSNPQLVRPNRDKPSPANAPGPEEGEVKLETLLVNLNVSATDRDGKAIAGLKREDFSVYEDGVLQQISFFSPDRSPFNLVLLIDLSGSMKNEIELIKDTAKHFLDVISAEDSVAVVTFTTDVTVVSHLTKDREDLRESIDWMLAPAGGTSFYDALGYALVEVLRKVKGQRNAVVAITDGEDNSLQSKVLEKLRPGSFRGPGSGSFLSFEELLDGATESDALIYPIHLNAAPPQPVLRPNQTLPAKEQSQMLQVQSELTEVATKQLRSLADATGARFYHANRIADLKGVFEQVAAELRTVYSMAYTPTNQNYKGDFRKIRVQVNSTDVVVRTRPGYYGR